jgi:RNA polymerase sigma factor (sigma-70 family)
MKLMISSWLANKAPVSACSIRFCSTAVYEVGSEGVNIAYPVVDRSPAACHPLVGILDRFPQLRVYHMFDRHGDLKLIRRCKRGEEAAFQAVLDRYRTPIYNLCWRMTRHDEDARDLAQEIFIKVFRLLDRFDEQYAFHSWLFRIASNHCIDHLRRQRLRFLSLERDGGSPEEDDPMQIAAEGPQPDQLMQDRQAMEKLEEIIAELPPHYRTITLLRHDQQLSYEEIAESLQLPLGTVKARIHRARGMIQQMLAARQYEI